MATANLSIEAMHRRRMPDGERTPSLAETAAGQGWLRNYFGDRFSRGSSQQCWR